MLKRNYASYLIVFITIIFFIPTPGVASVGAAKMVLGKVTLLTVAGQKQRLRRGGEISVGDTIITSKRGQAQLTMIDGTKISVRPDSQFQVEEFVATGEPEEQKTYYKLLKGGFRSVTGQIGKKNKSSFRLSTPVATMGIRGTDFTGKYCADDCPASSGKNGLFVDVISGEISMTNEGGTFNLDKETNGYVSDPSHVPESIEELPDNLLSPKAKAKPGAKKQTEYPSPEEEAVQIGLYIDPDNKKEILSEAMDAGVPPAQIMRGAGSAGLDAKEFIPHLIKKGKEKGMDVGDFVAPILESGLDANQLIGDLMNNNPESASDVLTAAIATGGFDNEALKHSARSFGVSAKDIRSADTVGNLFALPPAVKKLLREEKRVHHKERNPHKEKKPPAHRPVHAPELRPTHESGDVSSPS